MNRYLYLTGSVLLIIAGIVGLARANFSSTPWARVHGHHGGFPLAYLSHELNLTDTQRKQIKSIWAQERSTAIPLIRQFLSESTNMPSANTKGAFDEAQARAIADKQAATLSQLLVERQRLISRVYDEVLTPEQREKADQLRNRMHDHAERLLNRFEHSTD